MAFPTSPTANVTTHTEGGITYLYIGDEAWQKVVASTPAASDTVAGIVELATNAEATTGTDTGRAVTPAGVAASIAANALSKPTDAAGFLLNDGAGNLSYVPLTDPANAEINNLRKAIAGLAAADTAAGRPAIYLNHATDNNAPTGAEITAPIVGQTVFVTNSANDQTRIWVRNAANTAWIDFLKTLGIDSAPDAIAYAATWTPDLSASKSQKMTLTGPVTVNAPTGLTEGQTFVLQFIQDAVGGHAINFNAATMKWDDDGAPTLPTTASTRTIITGIMTSGTEAAITLFGRAYAL